MLAKYRTKPLLPKCAISCTLLRIWERLAKPSPSECNYLRGNTATTDSRLRLHKSGLLRHEVFFIVSTAPAILHYHNENGCTEPTCYIVSNLYTNLLSVMLSYGWGPANASMRRISASWKRRSLTAAFYASKGKRKSIDSSGYHPCGSMSSVNVR